MKKERLWLLILGLILIVSILLNIIFLWKIGSPNADNGPWLGFFGSFLGAIITGLVALYVLYVNRKQAEKNHKELYDLQIRTQKYIVEKDSLRQLNQQLISTLNFYRSRNSFFFVMTMNSANLAVQIVDIDIESVEKFTKTKNLCLQCENENIENIINTLIRCHDNVVYTLSILGLYNSLIEHCEKKKEIISVVDVFKRKRPYDFLNEVSEQSMDDINHFKVAVQNVLVDKIEKLTNEQYTSRLESLMNKIIKQENEKVHRILIAESYKN